MESGEFNDFAPDSWAFLVRWEPRAAWLLPTATSSISITWHAKYFIFIKSWKYIGTVTTSAYGYQMYWTQLCCWLDVDVYPSKNKFQGCIHMYVGPLVLFVSKSRQKGFFFSNVSYGVRALHGWIIWRCCFKLPRSCKTLMILFLYFNPKESTFQTFSSCSPNSLPAEWPAKAAGKFWLQEVLISCQWCHVHVCVKSIGLSVSLDLMYCRNSISG